MIGTVLGGPTGALVSAFGGVAASYVAQKLGLEDATVETVSKALQAGKMTPDQIVQLKQAEIEFEKFLEANKIDLERIAAADRDSARKMQTEVKSYIPGTLALAETDGFFGILSWMLTGDYPKSDALLVMLGSLGTAWTSIIAFYFGSSHGSFQKNELLARKIT